MLLQFFSGQRNEEVFSVEPSPEKKTDPQIPSPPPSHPVDIPTEPDSSHPLHNASTLEATPLPAPADEKDFKRVGKMTYNWALALFAISGGLLVNFHNPADYPDWFRFVLCAATAILEFLCLSTAFGIVYYSNIIQPSAELAKAQKKVLTSSSLILLLNFLCRLALRFPFLPFLAITVAGAVLARLVLFPLHRAHVSTPAAHR